MHKQYRSRGLIFVPIQYAAFCCIAQETCVSNLPTHMPACNQTAKSPAGKGWAKCLLLLVPTAGFELAT